MRDRRLDLPDIVMRVADHSQQHPGLLEFRVLP
jgi:hypothetical protein